MTKKSCRKKTKGRFPVGRNRPYFCLLPATARPSFIKRKMRRKASRACAPGNGNGVRKAQGSWLVSAGNFLFCKQQVCSVEDERHPMSGNGRNSTVCGRCLCPAYRKRRSPLRITKMVLPSWPITPSGRSRICRKFEQINRITTPMEKTMFCLMILFMRSDSLMAS